MYGHINIEKLAKNVQESKVAIIGDSAYYPNNISHRKIVIDDVKKYVNQVRSFVNDQKQIQNLSQVQKVYSPTILNDSQDKL